MEEKFLKGVVIVILLGIFCLFKGAFVSILTVIVFLLFSLMTNFIYQKIKSNRARRQQIQTRESMSDDEIREEAIRRRVEEERIRASKYRYSLYSLPKEQYILYEKDGEKELWKVEHIIESKRYVSNINEELSVKMSIPKVYAINFNLYNFIIEQMEKDGVYFTEYSKELLYSNLKKTIKTPDCKDLIDFNNGIIDAVADSHIYMHGEPVDPVYNLQFDNIEKNNQEEINVVVE